MPRVLTDGNIQIGAFMFSDRKRPSLCIAEGNKISIYGSFHNKEQAEEFMNKLGKMVGAKIEEEKE